MVRLLRIAATTVALCGAGIGLAGPASADLDPGDYTMTMTMSNRPFFWPGTTYGWHTVDCGPQCRTVFTSQFPDDPWNLTMQRNMWTDIHLESVWYGPFTVTVDPNTMAGRVTYHNGGWYNFQLTRN